MATCVAVITSQQQQLDCQVTELEQYTHQVSLKSHILKL